MTPIEYADIYMTNDDVLKNPYIGAEQNLASPPKFEDIKDKLPKPVWDGHELQIGGYYRAWELAFSNLFPATKENGFVSPFIDAAFSNDIFMWDTCFMLMFGRYATQIFSFQSSLDNFYCKQHKDGFICRQIHESNGHDKFYRHDPVSTGPDILAWTELLYYQNFGDKERLSKIYYPLLAYHKWNKVYRTWPNGCYWSSGWGCGMDNLPRVSYKDYPDFKNRQIESFYHGGLTWIDANLQATLTCRVLIEMAKELGIDYGVKELKEEYDYLTEYINRKMWNDKDKFYYDLKRDGSFSSVKTIASFWALIAKIIPDDRLDDFVAHLENENEFKTPTRVPSLSKDHPYYDPEGGYWNGGVWAPTTYMVLRGLTENGKDSLAYEIAKNFYDNAMLVYKNTGTFWENYAPETANHGHPARDNFVGWSGIIPITILIEYILGIQVNKEKNEIVWHIKETDRHGIENLYIGDGDYISLICEKRSSDSEKPVISVKGGKNIKIRVIYNGGEFVCGGEKNG